MSGWTILWVGGTWVILLAATLIYALITGKREEAS